METSESEKMNTAENKSAAELFEYEMTEILLKLKGEFAVISGKNINFDESKYNPEKYYVLSDPVVISEHTVQKPEIRLPSSDIQLKDWEEKEITIDKTTVELPEFVIVKQAEKPSVEVTDCKLGINLPKQQSITVRKPSAFIFLKKFDLPVASKTDKYENKPVGVTYKKIDLPVRRITVTEKPSITVSAEKFDLPEVVKADSYENKPADITYKKINVPDRPAFAEKKLSAFINPGKFCLPVTAKVKKYESKPIDVSYKKIHLPDVNAGINCHTNIKSVKLQVHKAIVTVPETISEFNFDDGINSHDVSVSALKNRKLLTDSAAVVNKLSKASDAVKCQSQMNYKNVSIHILPVNTVKNVSVKKWQRKESGVDLSEKINRCKQISFSKMNNVLNISRILTDAESTIEICSKIKADALALKIWNFDISDEINQSLKSEINK